MRSGRVEKKLIESMYYTVAEILAKILEEKVG